VLEGGGTRIETRVHIIRLCQLSAQKALASKRVALLPFVPLMRGAGENWKQAQQRCAQSQMKLSGGKQLCIL
jgi:hypothetical protein